VRRRAFLALPLVAAALPSSPRAAAGYPSVLPGAALRFPRDHGSHPDYRTEWWYATGWVQGSDGAPLGVQVTFFRNRPRVAEDNPSRFAARQLLFAHAAVADPAHGRLRHDQRASRAMFDLAGADEATTRTWIGDWTLSLEGGRYVATIPARDFSLELEFEPTQPILLQGDQGYSRKGPLPHQASWYYSRPQLAVRGRVVVAGRARDVRGRAWLDHEWSSEVMAPEAAGWDWMGINLADGGALMAFRMRGRDARALWAGGALREADGRVRVFAPGEIRFEPLRRWKSPRTEVEYPVAMRVRVGDLVLDIEPLMDDQELDSRASTGTIYWEGAIRAAQAGRVLGRGYLELTGYWKPLKL
jgi:predicted secreted hydrolase